MSNYEPCKKCGHAGSPEDPCVCEEKTRKIHVDVSLTAEMKKALEENALLKQQLKDQEANAIMANEALEKAEDDASEWRNYKQTHPPSGRAPFYPPADTETFADRKQMVDVLYDRAYYHKENFTPEQISDAKRKLDELWRVVETDSPSKRELKHGGSVGSTSLMACPNKECGFTIDTLKETKCPHCGYELKKHDFDSARRR